MSDSGSSDGEVDFRPAIDVASLPLVVRNRVNALKNLQFKTVQAECEYYKEVHQLDLKYQKKYDEINESRNKIIEGNYEPSGAEIEWKEKDKEEDAEEALSNGVEKITLEGMDENTKGIPKFWMYALKNANEDSLMGLVEDEDEAVLEHLTNITVNLNEPVNNGFTLNFHFSENQYFTNSVLTKVYKLRDEPDPDCPLEYDGPEIIDVIGTTINWKEGKDLTKRTVKVKKLKARKGAPAKDVTKEVQADSFFSFFSPPQVVEGQEEELTDEDRAILAMDFDVGFAIKEKVIPRAVLYFTGEAFDEDDEDYEDVDTEEEGDDDSDSEADN